MFYLHSSVFFLDMCPDLFVLLFTLVSPPLGGFLGPVDIVRFNHRWRPKVDEGMERGSWMMVG